MWTSYCLVVVLFIACGVDAVVIKTTDCGSKLLHVEKLELDCEGGKPSPCRFKKNVKYSGQLTLTPTEVVANATMSIHAILGGIKIPFPVKNPNLCIGHNIKCPMKPGETQVGELQLLIPSYYPSAEFVALFEVISPSNIEALCFKFPAALS